MSSNAVPVKGSLGFCRETILFLKVVLIFRPPADLSNSGLSCVASCDISGVPHKVPTFGGAADAVDAVKMAANKINEGTVGCHGLLWLKGSSVGLVVM